MKETLRQSMAWLHTWAGLLTGWLLFFVFLTGTFGYVNAEVDRWMRPELPLSSAEGPAAAQMLALAEARHHARGGEEEYWLVRMPAGRAAADFSIGWRDRPAASQGRGRFHHEHLDPRTGLPAEQSVRATGGGDLLYQMHHALHYMPYDWAFRIVGIATMFMFVAILSGIVVHRKIFADFFTFRPGRGQRSWLDGHNLLSVSALPFHLMITWSGLVFFTFSYMPVAVDALYPDSAARDRVYAQAYGYEEAERGADRPAAALAPLAPMLAEAERRWGPHSTAFITIDNPGRDNARVSFYHEQMTVSRTRRMLRFDGASGALTAVDQDIRTGTGLFTGLLLGLHEAHFAGPVLRALFVLAGLAGTAMIATGLLLWSSKRKAKLAGFGRAGRPHPGIRAVDVLNLGTIIGLPVGIAAYFWANRLLPVGIPDRGPWEANAMFIAWGLCFLYAIWRPLPRAWPELCALAAGGFALLPVVNALTTDRHLGITLPAGDWVLAGFDLSALATGLFFGWLATMVRRRSPAAGPRGLPAAEAGH
ncbi:PepSY-associated TM helix domain-containing protein [Marinibaculum pumilum]|uniref:PepSY-associated TM helix domain-containing protein n=1 Tax=Marinibaculum pumilum TaxID=1766165 RepID=A0ABV7KX75_9PROT